MFPDTTNNLNSRPNGLRSMRLRLNNQDLTDRSIIVRPERSPLYYDRLSMTLLNSNIPLKCLNGVNFAMNETLLVNQNNNGEQLIVGGNPVPITNTEKLLQVNLEYTGTGLQQLNLYKQVLRSVGI